MTPPSAANTPSGAADSQSAPIGAEDRRQPPLTSAARRQAVKYLTTLEFGRAVGKSERSIQRYCKDEKIQAIATEKGFRIPESEVERFLDAEANPVPMLSKPWGPVDDDIRQMPTPPDVERRQAPEDADMAPPAADTSYQRVSGTQPPVFNPSEFVPVDVHLAVFDRLSETETELRRSEQQRLALLYTLQQHQKVLAENAESLIEREARARQAEALAQKAEEETRQQAETMTALETTSLEAKTTAEVATWRVQELEIELAAERQRRQEAEAKTEALAKRSFWKKLFGQ